jgi:hypothetical protein
MQLMVTFLGSIEIFQAMPIAGQCSGPEKYNLNYICIVVCNPFKVTLIAIVSFVFPSNYGGIN